MNKNLMETAYDPAVWTQVSRRFRRVARLPEGLTGVAALQRANPTDFKAPFWQREEAAKNHYLRVYAPPEDRRVLTEVEWQAYWLAGGGSAGTNREAARRARANMQEVV